MQAPPFIQLKVGESPMNRKVLYLRIFTILLLIATVGIFVWEVERMLATPSQDDIFGHTGTVFIMGIILLAVLVGQLELFRSLKYFLTDEMRTKVKTVSNAIAFGLSGLALVISALTYLFFPKQEAIYIYYIWWTAGILVCTRLVEGICIERSTPWDDNNWINLFRILKNVLRYVLLIPLGFGCLMELVQLLSWLFS